MSLSSSNNRNTTGPVAAPVCFLSGFIWSCFSPVQVCKPAQAEVFLRIRMMVFQLRVVMLRPLKRFSS